MATTRTATASTATVCPHGDEDVIVSRHGRRHRRRLVCLACGADLGTPEV